MKLKRQIPKHLYDRGEVAKLGKPDFYVGPTLAEKSTPTETPSAVSHDDDLQTRMAETKEAAETAKAESQDSGSIVSLLHLLTARLRRTRPAR